MSPELQNDLKKCDSDIEGTLNRFSGDEVLYVMCLKMFLKDTTMEDLKTSIQTQAWDDAFTAAHALKGLAANMGFIPMFHASAEMVILIRGGRLAEIDACYLELERCYDQITQVIRKHFLSASKGE